MKRMLSLFVCSVLLLACFSPAVMAMENVNVVLNGELIEFDVPAQIINGRTMVPMRAIFEALDAEVEWDDETQTAYGSKMGIFVNITIDNNIMNKNCHDITLDTPAQLVGGRTLVPVRAISESFGVEVEWDENTNTVILSDKNLLQTIVISETVTFQGEVVDGKPFGYGTLYEFSDEIESTRIGLWDGLLLKFGCAFETFANGNEFSGYIVDDVPNGFVQCRWNDGGYYEGNMVNGEFDGNGTFIWPDGAYYTGNFKKGKRDGYGEIYFVSGDCYKGNYKNDEQNGYGEYYWAEGDYYKGNHLDGKAHGYGEYHYANGSYYIGDYANDERHGYGILYDANSNITYAVQYENGERVQMVSATSQASGTNLTTTSFSNAKFPLYLYSNDGKTFLGKLTTTQYDADSIFNEYGTYGSKYSTNSIWNEYGTYGSKYSTQSAFNPYTLTPPIIVDSNYNIIGYLTANTNKLYGVTILELKQILTNLNQ